MGSTVPGGWGWPDQRWSRRFDQLAQDPTLSYHRCSRPATATAATAAAAAASGNAHRRCRRHDHRAATRAMVASGAVRKPEPVTRAGRRYLKCPLHNGATTRCIYGGEAFGILLRTGTAWPKPMVPSGSVSMYSLGSGSLASGWREIRAVRVKDFHRWRDSAGNSSDSCDQCHVRCSSNHAT